MTWAKLDDQFFSHPKVIDRSKDAKLLFLAGLTYCAGQLTDGLISPASLRMICAQVDAPRETVDELLTAGLWEVAEGGNGGYRVHDYLKYNPPAEKVKEEKAKTAQRVANFRGRNPGYNDRYRDGSNGVSNGVTPTGSNGVTTGVSNGVSTASPSPSPSLSPSEVTDDSKEGSIPTFVAAADADSDEQSAPTRDLTADVSEPEPAAASTHKRRDSEPLPADSEAMRLATLLRDRIRSHTPDARVPDTSAKLQPWAHVVDLMLRLDRRAPPDVAAVIAFATSDNFWRANILSPGSLRDKYDQLNIKRHASTSNSQNGGNGNGRHATNAENGRHAGAHTLGGGAPPARFTPEYYARSAANGANGAKRNSG